MLAPNCENPLYKAVYLDISILIVSILIVKYKVSL